MLIHDSKVFCLGCIVLLSASHTNAQTPVGDQLSRAQTKDGFYISWHEHIIDDSAIAGFALSGSDGLVVADIDNDGYEDIVSVHESDSEYDSGVHDPDFVPEPAGHVRIAFGSQDPNVWENITLAEGTDVPAPEDAAIADVNGDGYADIVVAAELSHLIYFENPGKSSRTTSWKRLILPMTRGRGSYLRVFLADFNNDGTPEIVAANKGAQRPGPKDYARKTPVSIFHNTTNPLDGDSWNEIELGRYSIPQNSEPVDLDGDGDLDIIVGSRGELRIVFFENTSIDNFLFKEWAIDIDGPIMHGFNLEYADLNHDGRLDIIGATRTGLQWIEQPLHFTDSWKSHQIGSFGPDSITGLAIADIDGDGHVDIIAGSYSRGSRTSDGDVDVNDPLGRIGWFKNPGKVDGIWIRHDISRRKRGMYDKFIARDLDRDGDIDFLATRGNSAPFDGVIWLEQRRDRVAQPAFRAARKNDSPEMPLP